MRNVLLVLAVLCVACDGSMTEPSTIQERSTPTAVAEGPAPTVDAPPALPPADQLPPTWPDCGPDDKNPRYFTKVEELNGGKAWRIRNDTGCKRPYTLIGFEVRDATRPRESQFRLGYHEVYLMPGEWATLNVNIPMDCWQTDVFHDKTESDLARMRTEDILASSPLVAGGNYTGSHCQPPCPPDPLVGAPIWEQLTPGRVQVTFTVKPGVVKAQLFLGLYEILPNGTPWFETTLPQKLIGQVGGVGYGPGTYTLSLTFDPQKRVQGDLYQCVIPSQDLTVENIRYWADHELSWWWN